MSRIDCGKVKGEDYILTENDKIEIAEKVVPNARSEEHTSELQSPA